MTLDNYNYPFITPLLQKYILKIRNQYDTSNIDYHFRHLSMAFRHKSVFCDPITYGVNSDRIFTNTLHTHAEMDIIRKLQQYANTKKRPVIDILIIRINKQNQLLNSKPCSICVNYLCKVKHLIIKNIYYSNQEGNIVKISLKQLLLEQQHYTKRYLRSVCIK
jgi:tRNA(Arg) A34 adenosine deaminase TadA